MHICSVVNPDPELFPGSGNICSGSSKNERADKLKFLFKVRPVDSGQKCEIENGS